MTQQASEASETFARLASLACHDLRTPLATVRGLATTLARSGDLPAREAQFVGMIEQASLEMTGLLEVLSHAARIASGRYEPVLTDADSFALAHSDDPRIAVAGTGAVIRTDPAVLARALELFAFAAIRHGGAETVAWEVSGRELRLGPIDPVALGIVSGEELREVGPSIARMTVERLGGSVAVAGDRLRITL